MKKVIVVSGGSDGLGKITARRLAPHSQVIILSSNFERVAQAVQTIGSGCIGMKCDVANYDEVRKTVKKIIDQFGRIDSLINNAAIWIQGDLENNSEVEISRALDVNTKGVLYLTRTIIPQMKKQKSGTIINIVSQVGLYSKAERSVYNASKWALTGFTKSLHLDLAKHGIKVTGLYPGKMKTSMFIKMGIQKTMNDAVDPEDVAKTIEFILSFENATFFPEIGIKHLLG